MNVYELNEAWQNYKHTYTHERDKERDIIIECNLVQDLRDEKTTTYSNAYTITHPLKYQCVSLSVLFFLEIPWKSNLSRWICSGKWQHSQNNAFLLSLLTFYIYAFRIQNVERKEYWCCCCFENWICACVCVSLLSDALIWCHVWIKVTQVFFLKFSLVRKLPKIHRICESWNFTFNASVYCISVSLSKRATLKQLCSKRIIISDSLD